jgi:hypothetical protein
MASAAVRAKQRAIAVNQLITAANAAAEAHGIEPVEIPTHHRDANHLPTLQIEAVTALLERIAQGAAPAETTDAEARGDKYETEDISETIAQIAATGDPSGDTTPDAQKRPTRARNTRKDR